MKLAKFVLEIRFKEAGRPFNWRETLMQSIAGPIPIQQPQNRINEVIELTLTDQKAKIVLENTRLILGIESCDDTEELKRLVNKLIERVFNNVDWKKTLRTGIRTVWLESIEDTFENLVNKLKTKNFISNPITDSAADIAVSFTLVDGSNRINYNAGGMKKEEVAQRYTINTENIPNVALVTDVDYFSETEMNFSKNNIKDFVNTALIYSQNKANQTREINQ